MDESALAGIAAGFGVDVRDRTTLWRERLVQDQPLVELVRSADAHYGVIPSGAGRAKATAADHPAAVPGRCPSPRPSWTLRAGESMSSRVEQALAIIEANPDAHAFTGVFAEEARAAARALDERAGAGQQMGSLYGAVVAVKDIMSVRGRSISGGTRALQCAVAAHDAEVVRRLRAAGGVLIGTTNLHALAYGPFSTSSDSGAVGNPLRPGAVAGGSSGGSAAAVAMGSVDLAVGTDTAGSIRIPGALCGVVGLKGTYGQTPMAGVHPLAPSLDHVGPMARTVADVAVGWAVLSGVSPDAAREVRESLAGVIVGDPGDEIRTGLDAPVRAALDSALETAVRLDARVRPVDLPDLHRGPGIMLCTIGPEALDVHRDLVRDRASLLPEDVRLRLEAGAFIQAADYVRAQHLRARLRGQLSAALQDVDVLLLPTLPIVAPPLGALDGRVSGGAWTTRAAMSRFTLLGNLTGHPAITIPWARDHAGGGIGIQLMAAYAGEAALLGVAGVLEQGRRA